MDNIANESVGNFICKLSAIGFYTKNRKGQVGRVTESSISLTSLHGGWSLERKPEGYLRHLHSGELCPHGEHQEEMEVLEVNNHTLI